MATAYLSTGHQVPSASDDRDRVLLDRSRVSIARESDVIQKNGIKRWAGESVDRFGDAGTGGFDGNIVVFFEIDTGVLLRWVSGVTVKLFLHTHVTAANNVLTVAPGAVAEGFAGPVVPGGAIATRGALVAPGSGPTIDTLARATKVTRSSPVTPGASISATGGGSGAAGVVPAVPTLRVSRLLNKQIDRVRTLEVGVGAWG